MSRCSRAAGRASSVSRLRATNAALLAACTLRAIQSPFRSRAVCKCQVRDGRNAPRAVAPTPARRARSGGAAPASCGHIVRFAQAPSRLRRGCRESLQKSRLRLSRVSHGASLRGGMPSAVRLREATREVESSRRRGGTGFAGDSPPSRVYRVLPEGTRVRRHLAVTSVSRRRFRAGDLLLRRRVVRGIVSLSGRVAQGRKASVHRRRTARNARCPMSQTRQLL